VLVFVSAQHGDLLEQLPRKLLAAKVWQVSDVVGHEVFIEPVRLLDLRKHSVHRQSFLGGQVGKEARSHVLQRFMKCGLRVGMCGRGGLTP